MRRHREALAAYRGAETLSRLHAGWSVTTSTHRAPRARGAGRPAARSVTASSSSRDGPSDLADEPEPPLGRRSDDVDRARGALPTTCERCGSSEGEVHCAVEAGAWLCLRCYLSLPGGFYLEEEPASSTTAEDVLDQLEGRDA